MATHAAASEMKHHEQQRQTDGVDSHHLHPARCPADGSEAGSRSGGIGGT